MSWMDTTSAATYTGRGAKAVRAAATLHESAPGALHGYQKVEPKGKWAFKPECLDAWMEGRPCSHRSNVRQLRASA